MTQPYTVYNITPPTSADASHTLAAKYATHPTFPTYGAYTSTAIVRQSIRAWGAGILAEDLGPHGAFLTGVNGHEFPHGTMIHRFDVGTAKWQFPLVGPEFFKAEAGNFVPPAGVEAFYDPSNLNGYPQFTDNSPRGYIGNWNNNIATGDPTHGAGWSYVDWNATRTMSPLLRMEYRTNVGMGMRYDTLSVIPSDGAGEPAGTLVIMPNPFSHTYGELPTVNAHCVGLTSQAWIARSMNSDRDLGGAVFSAGRNAAYSKKHKKVYMVGTQREWVQTFSKITNLMTRHQFPEARLGAYIAGGTAVITNGMTTPHLLIVLGVSRQNINRVVLHVCDLDELQENGSTQQYCIAPTSATETFGRRGLKLLSGTFAVRPWPSVPNPTIHFAWAEKRKTLIMFQANRNPTMDAWEMPANAFTGTPLTPWAETLHTITIPDGSTAGVPNWKTQNWVSTHHPLSLGPSTMGLVVDSQQQTHNLYKRVSWSEKTDCLLILAGSISPVQAITLS